MKVQSIQSHPQKPVTMEGATGAKMRMLIGPDDGATNFHMRHFEIEPGGHTPHHQHNYEHEIIVLKGSGIVRSEQGERPIHSGDAIWVQPNEMHNFENTGSTSLEFICLIPAPQDCSR